MVCTIDSVADIVHIPCYLCKLYGMLIIAELFKYCGGSVCHKSGMHLWMVCKTQRCKIYPCPFYKCFYFLVFSYLFVCHWSLLLVYDYIYLRKAFYVHIMYCRGEQCSPAFARLHEFAIIQTMSLSERDVVFLQSRNCAAPLQICKKMRSIFNFQVAFGVRHRVLCPWLRIHKIHNAHPRFDTSSLQPVPESLIVFTKSQGLYVPASI